jgi:hypothetical protein
VLMGGGRLLVLLGGANRRLAAADLQRMVLEVCSCCRA